MKTEITHVYTSDNILMVVDGESFTAHKSHPCFDLIIKAITDGNVDKAKSLFNIRDQISKLSNGLFEVRGDDIFYTDRSKHVRSVLTRWVLRNIKEQANVEHSIRFLKNIEENQFDYVRDECHDFVTMGSLPICEDGTFLAYKSVKEDYMDIFSETHFNGVGETLEMPWEECAINNQCCSPGFHFGTEDFVTHNYTGPRVVVIQVDPRDLLATPNYAGKGRTRKYTVIGEIGHGMEYFKTTTVNIKEL